METVKYLPRVYFDTEEVRSSILLSPTIEITGLSNLCNLLRLGVLFLYPLTTNLRLKSKEAGM